MLLTLLLNSDNIAIWRSIFSFCGMTLKCGNRLSKNAVSGSEDDTVELVLRFWMASKIPFSKSSGCFLLATIIETN